MVQFVDNPLPTHICGCGQICSNILAHLIFKHINKCMRLKTPCLRYAMKKFICTKLCIFYSKFHSSHVTNCGYARIAVHELTTNASTNYHLQLISTENLNFNDYFLLPHNEMAQYSNGISSFYSHCNKILALNDGTHLKQG